MKTLWIAYNNKNHNPFGGRKMIGYVGWHEDRGSAAKEALVRYPNINPTDMDITQA